MKHATTRQRLAWRAVAATGSVALVAGLTAPLLVSAPAGAADRLPPPERVSMLESGPKQITLSWAPVTGATGYVVQVGTDENWSDVPTLEMKTVASRLTLPVWLPHADYLWRVAAVGEGGQGRWTPTDEVSVPDVTFTRSWLDKSTTSMTTDQHGVPTFAWTPVPGASEYHLQFSNSPTFNEDSPHTTQASPVVQACFTTRTQVTPFVSQAADRNPGAGECVVTLLQEGKRVYWRVRPLDHYADASTEVDTTPVVDEGISHLPPQPAADTLDTSACPAEGGIKPEPEPTSPEEPTTEDGTTPGDGTTPEDATTPDDGTTAPPAASGPCEPANPVEKGAWSATKSFVVDLTAPAQAADFRALPAVTTKALPAGLCSAANVCSDFPTISWNKAEGATSYRLYIALDKAYTNIQEIIETPALQWTPSVQWRESSVNQSYYYVVQPCTAQGCGQVTSTPPSFRKVSPAAQPTSPGDGGFATGHDVVLRWKSHAEALAAATGQTATSEAYAYRVQVTTPDNPDFHTAELLEEVETDFTHHVSAEKRYPEGDYIWRVQAVDASGHKLRWSPTMAFQVDAQATVLRTSPPGAEVYAGSPIRIRFSEPVTNVTSATVGMTNVPLHVTQPEPTLALVTPAIPLVPGQTHTLTVNENVKDSAGQGLQPFSKTVTVGNIFGDTAPFVRYDGFWAASRSSQAGDGIFHRATPDGRTHTAATFTVRGTGVVIDACTGPSHGIMEVWVDGVLKARPDTYSPFTACRVPVARIQGLPVGDHTVQIRATGAKNRASKGAMIGFDGGHSVS